ncbi:MAG: tetratricopeptide repeat protein [Ktedonobacteraceae bacterium]
MVKNARKFPPNLHLRKARVDRGWSQRELAERIGTTPVNISRWENGSTFPFPYFRQRLGEVFGKTPDELGLVPPSEHGELSLMPPPPAELSLVLPAEEGSRIWSIPIAHNPFFTGREHLLATLHERLSTAKTAALTQSQAQSLFGLGGIGKTQTAAEYAFRYGDEYANVFWIRAAKRETLVADFVTLAQLLKLPEKDGQDQRRIVAAVKLWLAAHEDWLLIMDNADDLPLAQEFLPTGHKGYILFTTRAQAAGAIAASVEVEKLSLQEGILLLLHWTKILDMHLPLDHVKTEDRVAAEGIVKEMDGLPLAIVQAAAYVEETGCSLTDYLSLYATHRKDLLAQRGSLLLDYPDTVLTTWSLSFQQVEQESPAAADALRLCAFLAPDAIPEELLTRSAAELGIVLGAAAADPFKLNEALKVLRRYSLVRRDGSTHMLRIHRLVQTVLKESLDQETQRIWAERTVRAVNAAFPEGYYDTDKNHQYYLPHVQECATLIKHYHLHFLEAAQLLYQAGAFLRFHGFYPQSQSLHQQALTIRKQVLGPEHRATADSLNELAVLCRIQGDYEQAEGFHRQALAIREKELGLEHPTTALSLNDLGVLYRTQGKYEQAEPLLQQALSIREQLLGSEHLDTLTSFINLGKLYLEQGRYEQAEPLLQQALATSTRVLDPEHLLIAQNLNLLARLSYEQGNNKRAETLWKQSLTIIEKTHGSEHPATAERLNDLAELFFAQGRYAEAQSLCERALSICEKILGPEHSDTITVRRHLAKILSKIEVEQDSEYHPAPPVH